jgi:hypothetical protein
MLRARSGGPFILLLLLLAVGCSTDDDRVQLTEPAADARASGTGPVQDAIDQLFPPPGLRQAASAKLASIQKDLAQSNTLAAQLKAADLSAFVTTHLNNGKLLDPNGSAPPTRSEAVALLTCELQKEVSPGSIAQDCDDYADDVGEILDRGGAVGIIGPAGGTIVTPERLEGISVPAGATLIPRVITVDPIPAFSPGDGPLVQPPCLAGEETEGECLQVIQYPLFAHFTVQPAEPLGTPDFLIPVTVGLCHLDPADGPFAPPSEAVDQRLRIAHNVGNDPTTLEVLAKTEAPFLDCLDFDSSDIDEIPSLRLGSIGQALQQLAAAARPMLASLLPDFAYAAMGKCCLGGLATKLSPFGAVDPGVLLPAQDPAGESDLASGAGVSTAILFNNVSDETVRVYWIDGFGNRNLYWTLAPGESYVQQTFLTHPWVITNLDNEGLAIYQPVEGLGHAEFTGPVGAGPYPPPEPPILID